MNSKQTILEALRAADVQPVPPPVWDPAAAVQYPDKIGQFRQVLEAAGGRCLIAHRLDDANRQLDQLAESVQAAAVCSLVPGLGRNNRPLDAVADPHELADLDLAILPAAFGVAENGAVWLTDEQLRHRAVCFIAQHVALVLQGDGPLDELLVHNLHEAYRRIRFTGPRFGLFVSGPSKTADIEQSLVIGAHGPRSLTVLLIGPAP